MNCFSQQREVRYSGLVGYAIKHLSILVRNGEKREVEQTLPSFEVEPPGYEILLPLI